MKVRVAPPFSYDAKTLASIGTILRVYPAYVSAVERYLERQGL